MGIKVVPKEEMVNMVGVSLEPSDWIQINQDRINAFADCTEDHQFIHVDEEAAAKTQLGGTIAHGFLTLSLLSKMAEDHLVIPENMVMAMNYGCDKLRFLAPVHAGKRIRLHSEILKVKLKKGNRFLVKTGMSVEIEGEKVPALTAEWLSLYVTSQG